MPQQSSKTNVHDRKFIRVYDVENKATLLESVPVQANAKTVPTCNATRFGHFARECENYAPLNLQGQSQGTTGRYAAPKQVRTVTLFPRSYYRKESAASSPGSKAACAICGIRGCLYDPDLPG